MTEINEDKKSLNVLVYFKIENPSGHRIQKIFAGKEQVQADRYYSTAFVTPQGVPQKYGINRENSSEHIIDALRTYLARHRPIHTELRGTFVAV